MYTVLSIVSIKKVAELCSRKKLFLTKVTNFSSGDKNLVLKMNYTSKKLVPQSLMHWGIYNIKFIIFS